MSDEDGVFLFGPDQRDEFIALAKAVFRGVKWREPPSNVIDLAYERAKRRPRPQWDGIDETMTFDELFGPEVPE